MKGKCPVCKKEFLTRWGEYAHMSIHPEYVGINKKKQRTVYLNEGFLTLESRYKSKSLRNKIKAFRDKNEENLKQMSNLGQIKSHSYNISLKTVEYLETLKEAGLFLNISDAIRFIILHERLNELAGFYAPPVLFEVIEERLLTKEEIEKHLQYLNYEKPKELLLVFPKDINANLIISYLNEKGNLNSTQLNELLHVTGSSNEIIKRVNKKIPNLILINRTRGKDDRGKRNYFILNKELLNLLL